MNIIKNVVKKIIFGPTATSEDYIKYLESKGVVIGEGTRFFSPRSNVIDVTRPWLLSFGDNVQITNGVKILTHGFDWSVLKGKYGRILGSAGKVYIGNNVFIGMNSTILKGVTIGDNVIIGANSLVSHSIPDNCVAAGNPAKILMSISEYYEKRIDAQYAEASELVREYRKRNGGDPGVNELHEFFWLFEKDPKKLPPLMRHMMSITGNEEQAYNEFANHTPMFHDLQEFLDSVK